MPASLTAVVMQFLTAEIIAQIASFLGLDKAATQKAVGQRSWMCWPEPEPHVSVFDA